MTITTLLETLPAWLGLGAGGGAGFFAIKWFFEWLGGRVDKREAALDLGMGRLDAATQALIKNLSDRLTDLTSRLGVVEHELADCRTKHAEAAAEVMQLRALVQGLGDARQTAQVIVSAERIVDRRKD